MPSRWLPPRPSIDCRGPRRTVPCRQPASGLTSTGRRNLLLASFGRESLDVNFIPSRFARRISDPSAIRRDLSLVVCSIGCHEGYGLSTTRIIEKRQKPQVGYAVGSGDAVDGVSSITGPVIETTARPAEQNFFIPCAAGVLDLDGPLGSRVPRSEHDASSVGGPEGFGRLDFIKCDSRTRSVMRVDHTDLSQTLFSIISGRCGKCRPGGRPGFSRNHFFFCPCFRECSLPTASTKFRRRTPLQIDLGLGSVEQRRKRLGPGLHLRLLKDVGVLAGKFDDAGFLCGKFAPRAPGMIQMAVGQK